jgi:hypothetical protein
VFAGSGCRSAASELDNYRSVVLGVQNVQLDKLALNDTSVYLQADIRVLNGRWLSMQSENHSQSDTLFYLLLTAGTHIKTCL